jgi:hypothetical protein
MAASVRTGIVAVVCALIAGCSATVTHQQETADATGIRYYENAPYVLIYSDGKGGLKWQIRYLPDQSKIMTAKPSIVGGRTEMTLYFQNGVLASASTVGDTTEIPKAIIAAVQGAIPQLLKLGIAADLAQEGFPPPYLYKIVVAGDKVSFIGSMGDTHIQVPINQGQGR